jgi:RNA polymerase sigma-70 factor (ECF subfamily)
MESTMQREPTRAELERALAGDEPALGELVALLTPVVQARVARTLLRFRPARPAAVRQQVEDLTQEIFLLLFADGARVLRGWDPERGLSLRNFVGYVTERQALSILRTARHNPWTEEPTLPEDLDGADPDADPGRRATSRDLLRRLLRRLEERLSPLGRHLFELIYLRERSVSEVEAATGLSSEAVYAWRSRLRKLARQLRAELLPENDDGARGYRMRKGGAL